MGLLCVLRRAITDLFQAMGRLFAEVDGAILLEAMPCRRYVVGGACAYFYLLGVVDEKTCWLCTGDGEVQSHRIIYVM